MSGSLELSEARLLLRYAAQELTPIERAAAEGFARNRKQAQIAQELADITRGGVFYAQQRAFDKMRKRLNRIGLYSTSDVLSSQAPEYNRYVETVEQP